ncbi:DUF721 domain-containing protein [Patescibacteria group bacterium]|nr:DUF721 domain-containing protein [Patescibacteria group bacterium]
MKTQPISFRKRILFVKVQNSTLAQELKLSETEIIKKINNSLPKSYFKKIVFKIFSPTKNFFARGG